MSTILLEISITKKGLQMKTVEKVVEAIRASLVAKIGFDANLVQSIRTVNTNPSRADRLSEANNKKQEAADAVRELAEEMENWYDSIPENLQQSDKASQVEEARDSLNQAADDLENVDLDGVEFPQAFG